MSKVLMRLGKCAGALALGGALALTAGPAAAGEWEVRLPVQKTARISPQEPPAAPPAEGAAAVPAPAGKAAPKTALARAAEAAAVAAIPPKTTTVPAPEKTPAAAAPAAPVAKHSAPAPGLAEKNAPKPAAKEAAHALQPAPKPAAAKKSAKAAHSLSADPDALDAPVAESAPAPAAPAVSPVSAPKAAPGLDPKAAQLPPAKTDAPTPLALPAEGKWVGDVDVEFQENAIVLHAATNGAVERVTWFNLAEANGPRKLAVDLRGPWRKKGASVLRYEVGPVKNVVVGEHEDRLRISLEFRAGAVTKELEPVLVRGENGLRLTIPLAVRLAH